MSGIIAEARDAGNQGRVDLFGLGIFAKARMMNLPALPEIIPISVRKDSSQLDDPISFVKRINQLALEMSGD